MLRPDEPVVNSSWSYRHAQRELGLRAIHGINCRHDNKIKNTQYFPSLNYY